MLTFLLSAVGVCAQTPLAAHCSTAATSATAIACTMSSGAAVVAGGTLVVMATPFLTNFSSSSATFVSITDGFTLPWSTLYDTGGRQILCAPVGAHSGSDTVTVTYNIAANDGTIAVNEWPGTVTCTADGSVVSSSSGGNPVTASITTTNANDLVIGAAHANWGAGGGGDGTGFADVPDASIGIHSQYRAVTSTGTYIPSTAPNSPGGTMLVIALKVQQGSSVVGGPTKTAGPSVRNIR